MEIVVVSDLIYYRVHMLFVEPKKGLELNDIWLMEDKLGTVGWDKPRR